MERMTHSTNSHPNCAACQAPYTWVVEILCHLQRVGHMHSAKPPSKEWRWLRGCCGDVVTMSFRSVVNIFSKHTLSFLRLAAVL